MSKRTFTVQCGNVSIGDKTVGIAVKLSRDSMPVTSADDTICGRRLDIKIKRGQSDPNQESIPDVEDNFAEIEGMVEVKSFRVTTKNYTFTACFMIDDIHPERLHEFAKRECTLQIVRSAEIPPKKTSAKPIKGQRSLGPTETSETPKPLGDAVKAVADKAAAKKLSKAAVKAALKAGSPPAASVSGRRKAPQGDAAKVKAALARKGPIPYKQEKPEKTPRKSRAKSKAAAE